MEQQSIRQAIGTIATNRFAMIKNVTRQQTFRFFPPTSTNELDKVLAKCHEIAVLYPSSRNPPAWLGKIHGITFFTPTGTP
jgi:hypothetical protein